MKEVKTFVYLVAIALFVLNYAICDYFYYNDQVKDLNLWWGLKSTIYGIIVFLVLQASTMNQERGLLRFVLEIGSGLAAANVIDKLYFNVLVFNKDDIKMILITFALATVDYYKPEILCQITKIYLKLSLKTKEKKEKLESFFKRRKHLKD